MTWFADSAHGYRWNDSPGSYYRVLWGIQSWSAWRYSTPRSYLVGNFVTAKVAMQECEKHMESK